MEGPTQFRKVPSNPFKNILKQQLITIPSSITIT